MVSKNINIVKMHSNLDIYRIIFCFDRTKIEDFSLVLNEFISYMNKLRRKTLICSKCDQDKQNKYKYYDKSENKIKYRTDCSCYLDIDDTDDDSDDTDDDEEDKIKLILAVNNEKDIKKFQKNLLKFISEKSIGNIEYKYIYINQSIRKISKVNIHNEANKIIYFFRKYFLK